MRILIFSLIIFSGTILAEEQFALVDSVNIQKSGNSFLSFETGSEGNGDGDVVLNGTMWHQEDSRFQNISVVVTPEARNAVAEDNGNYSLGNLQYAVHERVFKTNSSTIIRKMLISEDRSTMVGLSDDPGPFAIAAILAASSVALCTAQVVYNMYTCDVNKPRLKIEFEPDEGFICEAKCA